MHPAAAGVRTRLSPVLGPPAHGKRPKRRKIQTVSVAVASTAPTIHRLSRISISAICVESRVSRIGPDEP